MAIGAYEVKLYALNWVGTSPSSLVLTVFIATNTSPSHSYVSGSGIAPFSAQNPVTVVVTALATDGSPKTSGGDYVFLRVADYCEREPASTYPCKRVPAAHSQYNRDIFNKTLLVAMADPGNGTYSSSYNSPASGWISASAILGTQGGLLAEYFENIFLDGNASLSRIDSSVDFHWGIDLITPAQADYVSARWSGFLRAPLTETFTISVRCDDGARVYLDYTLLIDNWDTPGEEAFGFIQLT